MSGSIEPLILDLVEFVAARPRPHPISSARFHRAVIDSQPRRA
jgi:hypothetical protein